MSLAAEIKKHFPFFAAHPDLVYLDTAATSQKPQVLMSAMEEFMFRHNAPVHRAAYNASLKATELYESARERIGSFMGAGSSEVIFTKGATEALNLIAFGLYPIIAEGDEILVLETEHHANLLPWQRLAQEKKAKLVKIPVLESGHLDFDVFKTLINAKTKLVAIAHMSNVTGCLQDIESVCRYLKPWKIFTIIDGAQGICHTQVDVKKFDCDAYVFSSHKFYGPTGLGVAYLSQRLQESLRLYQVGGDVIESVSFETTLYKTDITRFEAGTPMVAEVISFAKVLEFLSTLDMNVIKNHDRSLISVLKSELAMMPGVRLIGSSDAGLVSFFSDHVHALDLATYLNTRHIAMRSGHLCAQPALKRFHTTHAARISCGIYTEMSDIEKALSRIEEALVFFS